MEWWSNGVLRVAMVAVVAGQLRLLVSGDLQACLVANVREQTDAGRSKNLDTGYWMLVTGSWID